MFIKYGIPQVIYGDRTSILWNQIDGELTQVGRMLEELGIELIYANSSEAKGKIEKMNYTIQNRLLNDIKRFNIKTYTSSLIKISTNRSRTQTTNNNMRLISTKFLI